VISAPIMGYGDKAINPKCILRQQDKTRVKADFKLSIALLYKGMSTERRKGDPPILNKLGLYTVGLPPSYHCSYSNVPSKSSFTILHTTITTLINITMPYHPTMQHLRPLPDHTE